MVTAEDRRARHIFIIRKSCLSSSGASTFEQIARFLRSTSHICSVQHPSQRGPKLLHRLFRAHIIALTSSIPITSSQNALRDLNKFNCSINPPFRRTHRFKPMESIAIQLLGNPLRSTPHDLAVDVQACEVHGAGQQGEGRVVERFVSFRIAPAFDGEVSEGGAILGANGGEECVHGRGVFNSEGVAGVEDGLGFGIDCAVEKENIGREDGYGGSWGGVQWK